MLPPVILHADLDCFYCQVERIRLGLPEDLPMAVQQWAGVIAVNYPARAHGVSRLITIAECLAKSPDMVFVHVPTFSIKSPGTVFLYPAKGPTKDEPVPRSPDVAEHKASLSPYRKASLAIFKIFGRYSDVLERAGLDEAFIDITKSVDEQFRVAFGVRAEDAGRWGGLDEAWNGLSWDDLGVPAVSLNAADGPTPESMVNDLRIWLGAKVAREVRLTLRSELGYTCSVGVAHNKMLAKLGSARNKPFNQTFVLSQMVSALMHQVPLKKIRFLGGKLGALLSRVASEQKAAADEEAVGEGSGDWSEDEEQEAEPEEGKSVTMASDLWPLSRPELADRVGGDMESASWVYDVIRGVDSSPVTPRTKPKSFMAAKSLRPPLKEWSQLETWLRLLSFELWERLEDDHLANQRWPRTLTLYFRALSMEDGKTHSTEFPIFSPDLFSVDLLVAFLLKMLHQERPSVFPMSMLTLSVSKFVPLETSEDGKRWSTLDRFFSSAKRAPPESADGPGPKSQPAKKPKRDIAREGSVNPDTWKCSECGDVLSMWDIDHIQEHQDFHLASKLAG